MTHVTRSLLTAAAALAAALAACLAGCQSATSTVVGAGLTSAATSATGATAAPASAAPSGVPSTAAAVSAALPVVYLAEGGSVTGTALRAPACPAGCMLSGDGTTSLWDMTWTTWNAATAAGTGTEKLDDCTPDCAAGTLSAVPVNVTLSRPVLVCTGGPGRWFWTRVSFTWPRGLPPAFAGDGAPLNPFDYDGLASRAARSCP